MRVNGTDWVNCSEKDGNRGWILRSTRSCKETDKRLVGRVSTVFNRATAVARPITSKRKYATASAEVRACTHLL
jgi:hypothetical protein